MAMMLRPAELVHGLGYRPAQAQRPWRQLLATVDAVLLSRQARIAFLSPAMMICPALPGLEEGPRIVQAMRFLLSIIEAESLACDAEHVVALSASLMCACRPSGCPSAGVAIEICASPDNPKYIMTTIKVSSPALIDDTAHECADRGLRPGYSKRPQQ